jgi:hypothetical protein
MPHLIPRPPIFNSDSASNIVPGVPRYNSDTSSDIDSDRDRDSEGESDNNRDINANGVDNDDDEYGDDNDDVCANSYARTSNIHHNNADEERPTATFLPSRPMAPNQDHSDRNSNSDGIQTTANIHASPDNTPASQKTTASHTSQNPSTLTPLNLLHNQPSGDVLDDCPLRLYMNKISKC